MGSDWAAFADGYARHGALMVITNPTTATMTIVTSPITSAPLVAPLTGKAQDLVSMRNN